MIVNDVKTLKANIGGPQGGMDWSTWKPFVDSALTMYIIPALGNELLISIDGATEGVKSELLKLLQRAVSWYSYLIAIPQMSVTTGDSGIQQGSPQGTMVVGKWLHVELKTTTARNADIAFETALQFLEQHVDDKVNENFVFSEYRSSNTFLNSRKLLIKSATELTLAMPFVQNSRRLYLALQNYIKIAEDDYLTGLVGEDFWADMKTKISSTDKDELQVLRYCRVVVAYRAMEDALPFLNISDEMRLISTTDGLTNEDIITTEKATQIRNECRQSYERWGNRLIDFLNKKASDTAFKKYFESALYPKLGEAKNTRERFMKSFNDTNKNFVVL